MQVPSHEFMLRAGMIRMIAAGLYTYLPFGLLALRKVEAIVREEMNCIGQEFSFTTLIPKELWDTSGRWESMGDALISTQISPEVQYVLGPTHEESFTDFALKHLFSYNQLPVLFYQITTKFRNEKRPRYGVMRSREFIMKDGYSFHMSQECLDVTYQNVSDAYTKIFNRCFLEHHIVEADSGAMGGSASQEFMILNPFGENTIAFCNNCKLAANVEAATEHFSVSPNPPQVPPLVLVVTPGKKTIEDVSGFLKISVDQVIKSMFYQLENGEICMVLVRGDRILNEAKLSKSLFGKKFHSVDPNVIQKILLSSFGSWGPVLSSHAKNKIDHILVDESVKTITNGVVGANKDDSHYINFSLQRDLTSPFSWADVSEVLQGSICGVCKKGSLTISKGIELGHIFKLGLKYSKAFGLKITEKSGEKKTPLMGCYGIGVNRLLAAIIEQHHDKNGIIWPLDIAPFQINLVTIGLEPTILAQGNVIYQTLQKQGYTVLWDDRDESAGFKLADCDLLGCPYQIIVGTKFLKKGLIEIRNRKTKETQEVFLESVSDLLKK